MIDSARTHPRLALLGALALGAGTPGALAQSGGQDFPPDYADNLCDLLPFVDCNNNGIKDCVDLINGLDTDCNRNGIPDGCEISADPTLDSNADGIIDSCQDCDGNGVPDPVDLLDTSLDCDGNGILDSCELSYGDLADAAKQTCQPDGVLDICQINDGLFDDCDGNGIPDICDLQNPENDVAGPAGCGPDGILDACQAGSIVDCNRNGIPDDCEIVATRNTELIFIFDGSGSAQSGGFNNQLTAAHDALDHLAGTFTGATYVSVIKFSNAAAVEISRRQLSTASDAQTLGDDILTIAFPGGSTVTELAIGACAGIFDLGTMYDTREVILITDGGSNLNMAHDAADALRSTYGARISVALIDGPGCDTTLPEIQGIANTHAAPGFDPEDPIGALQCAPSQPDLQAFIEVNFPPEPADLDADNDGFLDENCYCPGDVDRSGTVDSTDQQLILLIMQGTPQSQLPVFVADLDDADINNDGSINFQDMVDIMFLYGSTPPGCL